MAEENLFKSRRTNKSIKKNANQSNGSLKASQDSSSNSKSDVSSSSLNESNLSSLNSSSDLLNEKGHQNPNSYHQVRDSLLSSASGYTNYRGILNLCVVLLVMSTGRLVIENIIKYGFLVRFDVPLLFIKDPTAWPSLLAIVLSNIFMNIALHLEKKLEKGQLTEKLGGFYAFLNIFMALLLPAIYLWYREANPVSSFFALATYTCLSMKLVSYYQVNKFLRKDRNNGTKQPNRTFDNYHKFDKNNNNTSRVDYNAEMNPELSDNEPIVEYPQNLNHKDLYYFMAAPTLCYEINFPRSKRIRKRFLIRRIIEISFLTTLQLILLQQWIVPILRNSKLPFRESNILKIIERLLKLAVPNHVIWLVMFYTFFHSYLNVLAEILRFGDRQFYRDWWNCETVSQFWKNWNIPVHNFCLRHIYKPLLGLGLTKLQASLIVFFISAFFHEYLVSIPLRMFRLWSFLGMILQIPFAALVQRFLHGNYGNMAVWISLIIGQPIAIMMYIHDFYIDYFSVSN